MSAILDSLKANQNIRKAQRWNEQDGQRITGVLTNYQGFNSGVSLNSNGNRAYVGIGGGISDGGSVFYSKVVNAWIDSANSTFQPGEPVTLRYAREENRYYITGVDVVGLHTAGGSQQFYNHMSPDRLFIDSGFLKPYLCQPVISDGTSTLVYIFPGVTYYYDVTGSIQRSEFDGTQVDIAAYVATSGNHKILQLWIDVSTNTIEYTTSSNVAEATAFTSTEWDETLVGVGTYWLPLQSYEMTDTSGTSITQGNLLRDNRPLYTLPGGNGSAGSLTTRFENLTNGDTASPEIIFCGGDVVMIEVAA